MVGGGRKHHASDVLGVDPGWWMNPQIATVDVVVDLVQHRGSVHGAGVNIAFAIACNIAGIHAVVNGDAIEVRAISGSV